MYIMSYFPIFVVNIATVPYAWANIFIWHFVEYTIASKYYEIMVFCDLEYLHIWNASNYTRIATLEFDLSLWVTKGPRDW
jgi:hypothetical protein